MSSPCEEGVRCGWLRPSPGYVPPRSEGQGRGGCGELTAVSELVQCSLCQRLFHPVCLELHKAATWSDPSLTARRRDIQR